MAVRKNKPKSASNAGRKLGSGSQPLNATRATYRKLIIVGLVFCGLVVVLHQNSEELLDRFSRQVTKVRMENQWQSVTEAEVQQLLAGFMGNGFFDFDVLGVRAELEQHPWIRRAAVKKIWPDSISLHLTEEVAIARWGEQSILNQYGEVFTPPTISHLSSLPLLHGPTDSQIQVMEQYRTMNQLFFQAGLRVTNLELSPRGNWTLQLNDQIQVTAGRSDVMGKLSRFLEFYATQPESDLAKMVEVDLRYANGLAVKSVAPELGAVASR